jgi:hypothetical protein
VQGNWNEATDTANATSTIYLGFYEETLVFQFQNFGDLIRGKDAPYLGDLLGGFSKCSMSLTRGKLRIFLLAVRLL